MNFKNNVSIVISDDAMKNIQTGIDLIHASLPDLITLTPEQRRSLPKMGDKTQAFVSKSIGYARQNPAVLPKYLDIEEFSKDSEAYSRLFQISAAVQKLLEEIDDTMLMSGSEAYSASLAFYSSLKTAIAAGEIGLKAIYDDLSARFPGRPTAKIAEADIKKV